MVGTPAEVADQMEDYVDQVGGAGFMLSPISILRERSRSSWISWCRSCSGEAATGATTPGPRSAIT
jgi:hypothetical protein